MTSLFILTNIFFFVAALREPGHLKGTSTVPFLKLVEKFDPNILCPSCEILCGADSRHCYICN